MDHMAGNHYARACRPVPGRCFQMVYDEHGKPDRWPHRPIETGMLDLGDRWHRAKACFKHRASFASEVH